MPPKKFLKPKISKKKFWSQKFAQKKFLQLKPLTKKIPDAKNSIKNDQGLKILNPEFPYKPFWLTLIILKIIK